MSPSRATQAAARILEVRTDRLRETARRCLRRGGSRFQGTSAAVQAPGGSPPWAEGGIGTLAVAWLRRWRARPAASYHRMWPVLSTDPPGGGAP